MSKTRGVKLTGMVLQRERQRDCIYVSSVAVGKRRGTFVSDRNLFRVRLPQIGGFSGVRRG